MNKITIIIALSILFQTTLYAENHQAQDNINTSESDPKITTPDGGSQYNLDGMQTQDGQYKSSYSTNSVDNRNSTSNSSSAPYGTNRQVNPDVPVIIVVDE